MRFFLVLAAIAGIGFYAFQRVTSKDDDKPKKSLIGSALGSVIPDNVSASGNAPPPPSIRPYAEGEAVTDTSQPAAAIGNPEPIKGNALTYRFKHREPPEGLSQAGSLLGLQVIVDAPSRSVFVYGSNSQIHDFRQYLENIDLLPGSCSVRTWAVYVDRSAQSGFDLVAAIKSVVPETTATFGNGSFVLDLGADDIAISLAVIADGSSVEVLQRPHVRLEHGVQSIIESIQEVPVPQTTASQGISQTSVEYRKVGLQLAVTPHFLDRDQVRLSVKQTNGLIGQTVRIDGNEVPVIQSQTVQTQSTLAVGQTVILGGVATRRETLERGLLRNVKETSDGYLYVILATSHDIPKAYPVGSEPIPSPFDSVPLSEPDIDGAEWIDGEVLPPRFFPSHPSK